MPDLSEDEVEGVNPILRLAVDRFAVEQPDERSFCQRMRDGK